MRRVNFPSKSNKRTRKCLPTTIQCCVNDLEIKQIVTPSLPFTDLLCNSVLHSLLVDGPQVNVGVAAGSGLDGRDDGGVTGGGRVDGSKAGVRCIARIPCNYVEYLLQFSVRSISVIIMYRNTNNTCASLRVKEKCRISPGSQKIGHFLWKSCRLYIYIYSGQ